MKIAVIGAGAMGCLFGGLLAQGGHDLWLIDVWREHVQAINERGLIIEEGGELKTIPVRATTDVTEVGAVDLVIVFVKAYDTAGALASAKVLLGPSTLVITFQNGIGNVEAISEFVSPGMVLAGVTSHGATMLGPGKIRHAGSGDSFLGEISGGLSPRVQQLAALFSEVGIKVEPCENILGLIWSKLMINVGINALTALTRLRNGDLLNYEGTRELMTLAVREAAEVARRKGITLPDPDPVAKAMAVANLTANNRSSMLQDVLRQRRTEIDYINGAIVREARALGLATPVNHVLTLLVKVLEESYDRAILN